MLERVTIQDIYRTCESTTKDLKSYLPQCLMEAWMHHVIEDKKYAKFWCREEDVFKIYTIFYAYLARYILNLKCCSRNRSKFDTLMVERLTALVLDKINSGYEMLDKIVQTNSSLFPDDELNTIYNRIECFFSIYSDTCCSCMGKISTSTYCSTCVKEEIIKEEITHYEYLWYNTGFRNVHQLTEPISVRIGHEKFGICVVPKPFTDVTSVNDLFIHREALVRFTHCKSHTAPSLSRCCAT